MKNFFSVAALLISGIAAAAGPQVHHEPGPVLKMDEGTTKFASILLDKQLTACVADFQKQSPVVHEITVQRFSPSAATYVVKGELLLGGDVITGQVYLTIHEYRAPATIGFGTTRVYQCEVATALHDQAPQE